MYEKGQWITEEKGNNVFSFQERMGTTPPQIYIPPLRAGKVGDGEPGTEIVFEEVVDGRRLSCTGLASFLWEKTSTSAIWYLIDNHNHAFAMWAHGRAHLDISQPMVLIHVDQHKDMRIPEKMYLGDTKDLVPVERYTCEDLHVGNFIVPAREAGMVGDIQFWDSYDHFVSRVIPDQPFILDIDLDIFAPELAYLGFDRVIDSIAMLLPYASIVTYATSPFFIEQDRALSYLHRILEAQKHGPEPVS